MWLPLASALLVLRAAPLGGEVVRNASGSEAGARHSAGNAWSPEFRFQASLWWDRDEAPLCGASVIDEHNLVTAAHCLYDGHMRPTRRPINFLRVTAGSADCQTATNYDVGYTYTHPSFRMGWLDNDVAVIRLKHALPLGDQVRSIELATSAPAVGTVCQLSGWGSWFNRDEPNATTLRHMDVIVETQDKCLGSRDRGLATPLICVAPKNGDAYTHADDGGPLTCSGRLAGVVARNGRQGLGVTVTPMSLHAFSFVAESLAHPGRSSWPFLQTVLTGLAEAAACLAVTVLVARATSTR